MNISAIFRTFFISFVLSFLFPYAIFAQTTARQHEDELTETLIAGDVVAIKSGNNYMIDNNGVLGATTTLSENAWWIVTSYGLQNVATGNYLDVEPSISGANYKLVSSFPEKGQMNYTGSQWYIGLYTTTILGNIISIRYRPYYNRGSWKGTTTLSNTNAYRINGLKRKFEHSRGVTQQLYDEQGLQQTHAYEEIVYKNDDEEKLLRFQVSDFLQGGKSGYHYICGYYRWTDYSTDKTVDAGLIFDAEYYGEFFDNGGQYITKNIEPNVVKYNGEAGKVIACDVSAYSDYEVSYDYANNTLTFKEPTLSYRNIFDIRPASEIAAQLDACKTNALETYNILAKPGANINIGPKYAWQGGVEYVNYYENQTSPTIVENCEWYNGNTKVTNYGTVLDNRVISVTAPTAAGGSTTYTLKSSRGNIIAQFNITAYSFDKTDSELDADYELTIQLDFDKRSDGTDRNGEQIDIAPLDWDETTYGFYYDQLKDTRSSLRGEFAEWSEYALLKTTSDLSIRTVSKGWNGSEIGLNTNISDQTGGYFMFVNANSVSGKVADLQIDKLLCQGSVVVTAKVVNAAASGSNVNLNFVVAGVNPNGSTTDIKTYTTGDLGNNGNNWQDIKFEVKLVGDYSKYSIRIDNNKADADGNCFGIDDIRIYTSKPKLAGTQVMAACPSWDMNNPKAEEENVALLRVDFGDAPNDELTYTWVDEEYKPLDLNYVGEVNNNSLGKIGLLNKKPYYNSMSDFLDSDLYENLGNDASCFFFTKEDNKDILYIVHKSDKFKVNKKYYSAVTFEDISNLNDIEKLSVILTNCTSFAEFEVMPRTRIVLAGEERNSAVLQNLAVGNYPLSVKAFGMDANDKVVSYDCSADWLIVDKDMTDAEKWGYANAIISFRSVAGVDAGVDALKTYGFTGLANLATTGKLLLNQSEMTANISERGVPQSFIAVPLPIENDKGFIPCQIPLEIVLQARLSAVLANPADTETYENKPAVVQGSSCVIRIPEGTTSFPEMKVDFINSALLANLSADDLTKLGKMVLCTTDNASYESKKHSDVFFTLESGTALNELKAGDIVTITSTDLAKSLEPGKYGFHSELEEIDGISITPAFNFDVYVVPSTVVWNPTLNNSAWHNDANWKTTEGKPAFIPLAETNVIIKGGNVYNAVLPESSTALGAGANQYLKYDIGVDYNSCKNIYFEAGAKLGRQHKLNYTGTAYVDMPISDNVWQMLSMPVESVVSGDLYIPRAGDGTFNWSVNPVDNRNINTFQLKVYNVALKGSHISNEGLEDATYTNYSKTKWSLPTNALNMPMDDVRGYAVCKQAADQDFVRLPKSAEEYRFYLGTVENGVVIEDKPINFLPAVKVSRENRAGKLIFDKDNSNLSVTLYNVEAGNLFLVGNPFMANLNVKKFFDANSTVLDNSFYYEYADGEIVPNQTSENKVLRPMRAMFVKTKNATTSLTLTFTADMISFSESAEVEVVPTKAPRRSLEESFTSMLTLTAQLGNAVSRTYIEEVYGALSAYDAVEDAELIVLDKDLTPISLYSVADKNALLYNRMPEIDSVPISLLVTDSTLIAETFTLTFEGIDNFDYDLYLYDALYDTELPLIEGLTVELELPVGGEVRYYVKGKESQGGVETGDVDLLQSKISVVNSKGSATIYSTANINSIAVYDVAGRLMSVVESLDRKVYDVELPMGVYMLQITTEDNVYQEKVVIK